MSIVESQQRRVGTSGAERIHIGHTTETRAKTRGHDTTGAELRARALEDQANAVLQSSSYHPVRRVSCEVRERVLVLRGRVASFHMKQIAQTVVRHLLNDGFVVDNRVEVDRT